MEIPKIGKMRHTGHPEPRRREKESGTSVLHRARKRKEDVWCLVIGLQCRIDGSLKQNVSLLIILIQGKTPI